MRMRHSGRRGFIRRSSNALSAVLAAAIIVLAAPFGAQIAEACGCKKPAVRNCSPSLTMWKWCKRVYRVDEPVVLDFSWLGVLNPPCPPGVICIPCPPEVSTVADFTVTPIGGGAPVAMASKPVAFVDGVISADTITLTPTGGLPWTPGIYRVSGKVTVTLADGTVLCATGDTCICLVEPSDADPGLPRLDFENLTPDGPGGTEVHPGDPQTNTYLFTNNRAVPVTIDLTASNDQRGGVPGVVPAPGAVVDPFSFADPGAGDDYPIAFDANVPDPCLLLPPLPHLQTNSFDALQGVIVGPFESVAIDVHSRGWQLCETGSGCEQVVEGTAQWTDGLSNEICVSGISLSNSAVPPGFFCPDSGSVIQWTPFVFDGNPVLRANAQPRAGEFYLLDYLVQPPQLFIDGNPVTAQVQLNEATTDTCRITYIAQLPAPVLPLPLDFFLPIDNFAGFPAQILGDDGGTFMPGVPIGFEHRAPTAKNLFIIDEDGDGVEDSTVMNLTQVQAEIVCDPNDPFQPGIPLDLTNANYNTSPGFGFVTTIIDGQTQIPPCLVPRPGSGNGSAGLPIAELHITVDIRSFAGGFPPPPGCFCDCDGNGVLNVDDIDCFVAGFLGGDLGAADCDNNGVLNVDDIDCFVVCFLAGCP